MPQALLVFFLSFFSICENVKINSRRNTYIPLFHVTEEKNTSGKKKFFLSFTQKTYFHRWKKNSELAKGFFHQS